IIHIPSEYILRFFPEVKGELYGDKKDSAVFDNSKIKSIAPNYKSETEYYAIVEIIVKHYLENAELQNIDTEFNQKYDKLIQAYQNEKS
ncbi:MAG: NAD-dependent dehydratase, partial [Candidatus Izimaplasma sp.]|nr:NAD-dependent dehydratase [Candidatus Izimaplasma bacterium]